jgi:hypothetical protein
LLKLRLLGFDGCGPLRLALVFFPLRASLVSDFLLLQKLILGRSCLLHF